MFVILVLIHSLQWTNRNFKMVESTSQTGVKGVSPVLKDVINKSWALPMSSPRKLPVFAILTGSVSSSPRYNQYCYDDFHMDYTKSIFLIVF